MTAVGTCADAALMVLTESSRIFKRRYASLHAGPSCNGEPCAAAAAAAAAVSTGFDGVAIL